MLFSGSFEREAEVSGRETVLEKNAAKMSGLGLAAYLGGGSHKPGAAPARGVAVKAITQ